MFMTYRDTSWSQFTLCEVRSGDQVIGLDSEEQPHLGERRGQYYLNEGYILRAFCWERQAVQSVHCVWNGGCVGGEVHSKGRLFWSIGKFKKMIILRSLEFID